MRRPIALAPPAPAALLAAFAAAPVLVPAMLPVMVPVIIPAAALAGEAEIVGVRAAPGASGWRFEVTLRHDDAGWDHYADAWEVRGADGAVFGRRTLHHPHVDEQPFTRALSGVEIPDGVAEVVIHARDSVHGWSPAPARVALGD